MKSIRLFYSIVACGLLCSFALAQGSAKVVKVNTAEAVYKIKRGGSAQISIVVEVDEGYHINSNRPSDKNLIPTALKIERTAGLTTTPVSYPRARLQKFEFSPKRLSVFEGKTILRLTVRALSSMATGSQTLKAKLTVQACNDQACLRPQTVDVNIPLLVE